MGYHIVRRGGTKLASCVAYALPGKQILKIDLARKAIVIKGCVPGKPGSVVEVTPAKIVSAYLMGLMFPLLSAMLHVTPKADILPEVAYLLAAVHHLQLLCKCAQQSGDKQQGLKRTVRSDAAVGKQRVANCKWQGCACGSMLVGCFLLLADRRGVGDKREPVLVAFSGQQQETNSFWCAVAGKLAERSIVQRASSYFGLLTGNAVLHEWAC
eukprot:848902-Pelagomonas_calceolata.AAC.1